MADLLVITGARIHTGASLGTIEDGVLAAEDGRIVYVGGREGARGLDQTPAAIDASGLTLIPGLIDCHVHLCFDGSPDFAGDADRLTPALAAERCVEAARRALEAGITTVRDLGGIGDTTITAAKQQAAGAFRGARIITAGSVLTAPGGHAHFIGREISSADEMVKAVTDLHAQGARAIKLIATGGVLTPGIGAQQSAFPPEQLEAAVRGAHDLGMRVAAHAIGAEGIEAALSAGVDSIEHGCFLTDTAIATMLDNPSWLVATLSAPDRISRGGDGVPEYARAKSAEVQVSHRASFAKAVDAGVRIASGTDAGTPYNFHGGLSYELRLMHESGMPLDRVLTSATREAAQLLGFGELGTLEPDKVADAVLLDGEPLEDVAAYERVAGVVQGGRLVVDRR